MKEVVIIGNGVSGITAARHLRKKTDYNITVISSETEHFFSRTALMYIYMGHMKYEHTKPYEDGFWKKNRIDLVFDHVQKIATDKKTLLMRSGKNVTYDTLVIATGSQSNFFGWEGQNLNGVQALYSYQDLKAMERNTRDTKKAVIVGGGLIGIEMAEMLKTRNIPVTFLVREEAFWNNVLPLQDANLISNHIIEHGVDLRHKVELQKILPDEKGNVKSVVTTAGERIPCDFLGITVGVHPNISVAHGSAIAVNKGILVNEFLETNIPDVYAIGDCAERTYPLEGRNNIEQVWYTARMMGEVVAQTISRQRTKYAPGPWFNSAKFFDIEYQTYGNVRNVLNEAEADLYWEHPSGKKAMHLVWYKPTGQFIGINTFGIRLRHADFDRWLRQGKDIGFVIEHLHEANFDSEFSSRHENEIKEQYYKTSLVNS
jgi:NAD(P)H-nitrite reductase large subunit